ncbi:MAG: hypothetical protein AB7S99_06525 [Pseudodonghicola sp.]
MTVAVWPDTLPRPLRDGYSEQRLDARLGKGGEAGPPGWRRRWSSVARTVAMVLDVPRAVLGDFESFYEHDLSEGSLPFWMPAPTLDGWPLLTPGGAPVLLPDGSPVLVSARWLCLMGEGTPTIAPKGVRFRVSFSVTVMP